MAIIVVLGSECAVSTVMEVENGPFYYSNVVILGDSQTDIGNMPESPTGNAPQTGLFVSNIYVPIFNPDSAPTDAQS